MAKKKATKKTTKKATTAKKKAVAKPSAGKKGAATKKAAKTAGKTKISKKKTKAVTAVAKKTRTAAKKTAAVATAPKKKGTTSSKTAAAAAAKTTGKRKAAAALEKAPSVSTKKKKIAPAAPAPAPVEEAPPMPKVAPLSKRISSKNQQAIRERLFERRAALLGSLGGLASNKTGVSEHAVQSGGDEIDAATYSVAADLSLRAAESESRELKEIELALSKLEDGSYGVCEATGKPVDVRRLLFMPAARLSLEAQEQLEKEQLYHDAEKGWVRQEFEL